MKPILATDAKLEKLKYPVVMMPKIDGVRALNIGGKLVGRSGKSFKNLMNTEFFSKPIFEGIDGEMVAGNIKAFNVCNATTSALSTIDGQVETVWHAFDYVVPGVTDGLAYYQRYQLLMDKVAEIHNSDPLLLRRICLVPYHLCTEQDALTVFEAHCLEEGFEGVIVRDPNGPYKYGRSTVNEGYFLRIKSFMDSEIMVTHVIEGKTNNNQLKANPHGYAERSTHAENMEPNGMIGTIVGTALEDVHFGNRVIISKGQTVEVSPGKMTHDARKALFDDQSLIVGKVIKYQFFPIGIKDKPRFPTFQSFRDLVDL